MRTVRPENPGDRSTSTHDWTLSLATRSSRLVTQMAAGLLVLALWQWVAQSGLVPSILVPAPVDIARQFWSNLTNILTGGFMLGHLVTTFTEVILGFAIAITAGLLLGALVSEFRFVRTVLMPYIVAFNATPRIALAPIFLIWFGFGPESKVMMAAATSTFPVLIGTIAGLAATDRMTLRLMHAYGATRWQIFRKVRFYHALPYIFAGLETGVVFAVIGAVVGEFMGGNAGLGFVIVVAQESLNLPLAFASLLLLSLLGLALHRLVIVARRRTVYWMDVDEHERGRAMT